MSAFDSFCPESINASCWSPTLQECRILSMSLWSRAMPSILCRWCRGDCGRKTCHSSPACFLFPSPSLSSCMFVTLDAKAQEVENESAFLFRALSSCVITAKRHFDTYVVRLMRSKGTCSELTVSRNETQTPGCGFLPVLWLIVCCSQPSD